MQSILERKLLIVEDDQEVCNGLRFALRPLLSATDIHVAIEHATTLRDAKKKLRSFRPHIISTDMEFPLECQFGRQDEKAGAALVSYVRRYHRSARCIVYSGADKDIVEEHLCDAGVNEFPAIVHKNPLEGGSLILLARILTTMLAEL